jgi:hypothetical protein
VGIIATLRDPENENYSLSYTAVLVFLITTIVPMNYGIMRLSTLESSLLFAAGFFSLFMLSRNEAVGKTFLNYLYVTPKKPKIQSEEDKKTLEQINVLKQEFARADKINSLELEQPLKQVQNSELENLKSDLFTLNDLTDKQLIPLSVLKNVVGLSLLAHKDDIPDKQAVPLSMLKTAIGFTLLSKKDNLEPEVEAKLLNMYKKIKKMINEREKVPGN